MTFALAESSFQTWTGDAAAKFVESPVDVLQLGLHEATTEPAPGDVSIGQQLTQALTTLTTLGRRAKVCLHISPCCLCEGSLVPSVQIGGTDSSLLFADQWPRLLPNLYKFLSSLQTLSSPAGKVEILKTPLGEWAFAAPPEEMLHTIGEAFTPEDVPPAAT